MWGRTLGSTSCLLPLKHERYFDTPEKSWAFLKGSDSIPKPVPNQEILKEAGAEKQWNLFQKYYMENDLFGPHGEEAILHPPPVQNLYAIYGTELASSDD